MKNYKFGIPLAIAVALFLLWQFGPATDVATNTRFSTDAASSQTLATSRLAATKAIRLPETISRARASDGLAKLWKNFSAEQATQYSLQLIEKSSVHEFYQVYYLGRPIEQLAIRRDLTGAQEVVPLTPYRVDVDSNVLSAVAVEARIRARDDKITSVILDAKVWGMGSNNTLYPAYRYSVTVRGSPVENEVWVANANTGEVASINTFSRN